MAADGAGNCINLSQNSDWTGHGHTVMPDVEVTRFYQLYLEIF